MLIMLMAQSVGKYAREWVTIGFGFLIGWESGARFLNQSLHVSVAMQNQS